MHVGLKLSAMGLLWFVSLLVAIINWRQWHWLVCVALAFSWVGDAILSYYKPIVRHFRDPFISGMGFFAVAQLIYILAASSSIHSAELLYARVPGHAVGIDVLPDVLPVFLLTGLLYWMIIAVRTTKPIELKVASLAYGELLCVMAAYAFSASFSGAFFAWQLALGGCLFIVSDSLIAMQLFKEPFANERRHDLFVWGTYFPAQLFLLLGFARLS